MAPRTYVRQKDLRRQSIAIPSVQDSEAPYATDRYFDGSCPAFLSVGDLVYRSGPSVGNVYPVDKCDPLDRDKMPGVGMVVSKPTTTSCLVQLRGTVAKPAYLLSVDLGKLYFIGRDGRAQIGPPLVLAPGESVYAQSIGVGMNADQLLLEPNFQLTIKHAPF